MITLFTLIAIINAILLISLFTVSYLKGNTDSEIDYYRYDNYQKELTKSLFIGIGIILALGFIMIL